MAAKKRGLKQVFDQPRTRPPWRPRWRCGCRAPEDMPYTLYADHFCARCDAAILAAERNPPAYLEIREFSTGRVFRFTVPRMSIPQRRRKAR